MMPSTTSVKAAESVLAKSGSPHLRNVVLIPEMERHNLASGADLAVVALPVEHSLIQKCRSVLLRNSVGILVIQTAEYLAV